MTVEKKILVKFEEFVYSKEVGSSEKALFAKVLITLISVVVNV